LLLFTLIVVRDLITNGCDGREKSEYQPNPFICIPLFHSDVTVLLNLQFQKMDISIFVSFFLFYSSLGYLRFFERQWR